LHCRPGRLELHIEVPLPGAPERLDILRVHSRRALLASDVALEAYAADAVTGGWSGAQLANLCREAGMEALRESLAAPEVRDRHFAAALRALNAAQSLQGSALTMPATPVV